MIADIPATETEAADLVRAAKGPLRILGGGTRQALGRPVVAATTISTEKLTGITLYEPSEMVIGARAGTPLKDIEAALAEKGQILPFEPMDHRTLLGSSGEPTIGGVAACNVSGPRRISPAGASRDSLIGVRFVNGRGEVIKSGGRVMKNVTGLDIVKLQAGAFGTLGLLTEVIFKVTPRPETERTLVIEGLDDARAVEALSTALTTPFEVSGAAHWPRAGAAALTAIRIEGFEASLKYRATALGGLLRGFGRAEVLGEKDSAALWRDIRDAAPLCDPGGNAVWRVSVRPTDGPKVWNEVLRNVVGAQRFYDWGGGLLWLSIPATGDCAAACIREAVARHGGHATLVRAPDAVRATIPVFQPEPPVLAKIAADMRASFDPDGLFNPGLMHG